ncbi:MAG TPA: LD-carboxypeptidase [bacterium]|nr:LD-carboxypeptidase [bacterium]
MYPPKLRPEDEIRVIAPSKSMAIFSNENQKIANKNLEALGLNLTFGRHVNEMDDFRSSSTDSRIEDLHDAFADKNVKGVLTVIGGFNSNQLLRYIDWELIRNNPKVFCGYSDITALNNAIFAKAGLVNYSGPHYSTFGQKKYFDFTLEYFKKCVFSDAPIDIQPSPIWTDDPWYRDQENRNPIDNPGWLIINEGKASGTILGANLCTFNLLQGTEYIPDLSNSILFLEDDYESKPVNFDRDLQSLIHQPNFDQVKGLVIGRFQKESKMTDDLLIEIVKTKRELSNIPVIANVNFGHADPRITFPIGGEAEITANKTNPSIRIIKH